MAPWLPDNHPEGLVSANTPPDVPVYLENTGKHHHQSSFLMTFSRQMTENRTKQSVQSI